MRQRTTLLEWHFVENKAELQDAPISASGWPPLVDEPRGTQASHSRLHRRYVWGGSLALLLLLAAAGAWLWQRAEAGLDQVEAELGDVVQIELASATPGRAQAATRKNSETSLEAKIWGTQLKQEQAILSASTVPEGSDTPLHLNAKIINLQGDLAVATFVMTAQDGTQAYRQARFYRQTADGWQRTLPQAALWGSPRQLESSHFIFHFRHNDAQVVATVAPQLDALYAELQRNFGLAPTPDKLLIEVSVETGTGTIVAPRWVYGHLVVPSPALYLAPAELSDNEILAQSIAIPLIDYMARRLIAEDAIPLHWQTLKSGLALWQLWELDMPLAQWSEEVVTWLYSEVPANDTGRYSTQPDTYQGLCTMHRLWMLSPVLIGIPLECLHPDEEGWAMMRMLVHRPAMHLDALTTPPPDQYFYYDEEDYFFRSTQAVAVATLLEYAVATYGYEQLPTLLASLAQHEDWNTLLPAVYGVSAAEFEEGWRMYLLAHYQ